VCERERKKEYVSEREWEGERERERKSVCVCVRFVEKENMKFRMCLEFCVCQISKAKFSF